MSMDSLDALDQLLQQRVEDLRLEAKQSSEAERWISWDEWSWRAGDKMLDEFRIIKGLKPIEQVNRYFSREKQLKKFLKSQRDIRLSMNVIEEGEIS